MRLLLRLERDGADHLRSQLPRAPAGDIYSVADNAIPPHHILCGGFPCQPFSIAGVSKKLSLGKKHGFEDKEQGNLFFTLAELIDHHRPDAFVLEHLKDFKTPRHGNADPTGN